MTSQPCRAMPPALAPPPFDPPVFFTASRVTGNVVSMSDTMEEEALDDRASSVSPTVLNRQTSTVRNILVVQQQQQDDTGYCCSSRRAVFLLQRKLVVHHGSSVRLGYVLQQQPGALADDHDGVWELAVPEEMVAVLMVHTKSNILENSNTDNSCNTELSALQLVATHDLEGTGHVLGTVTVAADHSHVYAVMTHHREGSLFDYCAAVGRLKEEQARFCFRQILKGLETLQRLELCHRNLSLETVVLSGTTCTLAALGSAIRIPIVSGTVHLIEPQPPCGSNPQYMAPELLQNTPFDGYAVDLFAAGVALFVMLLGGDTLFAAPLPEDRRFQDICVEGNLKEMLQRICAKRAVIDLNISDDALDLLQKMLRAEPKDRLGLSQVQQHAWVTKGGEAGATAPLTLAQPPPLGLGA